MVSGSGNPRCRSADEMLAGATWEDVTAAAAFCLGILFGGLAVVHITRNAIEYLREEMREHRDDDE